jgi:putative hydrolase of the HAD superfamily
VPLLLVDLDNTLIDRTGAFARWAGAFVASRGGSRADEEWLIAADRDGYEDRERLAAMIAERFWMPGAEDLVATLRGGLVDNIIVDDAVLTSLERARADGWLPYVVTNGTVPHQERKLSRTGLDQCVAGWVISEGVGVRKPDPGIFRLAAAQAGVPLEGAWMIGDTAEADIEGAVNAGISSVWLRRGRDWEIADYAPTRIADTFPEAVDSLKDSDQPQRR